MVYGLQFEVYHSHHDDQLLVGPIGFDDVAIPVENAGEAYQAATEWLVDYVDKTLLRNGGIFPANGGASGSHGGDTFYVCTKSDLSSVPAVPAADAASILGVSRSRVAQLCSSGVLKSWREGAHRMVSVKSIQERLEAMGRLPSPTPIP